MDTREKIFLLLCASIFLVVIGYHSLVPEAQPESWEGFLILIILPAGCLLATILLAFSSRIQGE